MTLRVSWWLAVAQVCMWLDWPRGALFAADYAARVMGTIDCSRCGHAIAVHGSFGCASPTGNHVYDIWCPCMETP